MKLILAIAISLIFCTATPARDLESPCESQPKPTFGQKLKRGICALGRGTRAVCHFLAPVISCAGSAAQIIEMLK
jgi:hypothetical protein